MGENSTENSEFIFPIYPQESSRRPDLGCIIRNPHNYYSWAKEELLSRDPRVTLVHDVINDREADKIKELATPSVRTPSGPDHSMEL